MTKKTKIFILIAMFYSLLCSSGVKAADTTETFDVGFTDLEFYTGISNIGLLEHEKSIHSEMLIGAGIVKGFSAYAGASATSDEYLENGQTYLNMGIFGTPLKTDHVDLDLFLDFLSILGQKRSSIITPSLELNLDMDPDMESIGWYLRLQFPIHAQEAAWMPDEQDSSEIRVDIDSLLGMYFTVAKGHQLLFEYGMMFCPKAAHDERTVKTGVAALGYNVYLGTNIEMINQVCLDIPDNGKSVALGISTGFIATFN